ncbi:MAG: hypothetical protein RBU21_25155 [FCB group bacterium]|jgi:hypothetical protein|nr:hypothetical protein [FCB group bacterium]
MGQRNRNRQGLRGRITNQQLEHIQQNHERPWRAPRLGEILENLPNLDKTPASSAINDVFAAIQDFVDDEFLELCSLHSVSRGEVVILVENPDFVYHMRVAWHFALKEYLERACPGRTIRKIIFKPGRGGARFTPSPEK